MINFEEHEQDYDFVDSNEVVNQFLETVRLKSKTTESD